MGTKNEIEKLKKENQTLKKCNFELEKTLKLFRDCLAFASLSAEKKTAKSYMGWVKEINKTLKENTFVESE